MSKLPNHKELMFSLHYQSLLLGVACVITGMAATFLFAIGTGVARNIGMLALVSQEGWSFLVPRASTFLTLFVLGHVVALALALQDSRELDARLCNRHQSWWTRGIAFALSCGAHFTFFMTMHRFTPIPDYASLPAILLVLVSSAVGTAGLLAALPVMKAELPAWE